MNGRIVLLALLVTVVIPLATMAQQQRLLSRMEVDQRVCSQYLVSVCIRLFLEKREKAPDKGRHFFDPFRFYGGNRQSKQS